MELTEGSETSAYINKTSPHFTRLPMKMELTEGSETSAYINQTPGNYP
jgi:molybdopterin-binding protein